MVSILPHRVASRDIYCGMRATGFRTAVSIVKDFCRDNRKSVASFAAVFALGIVVGIFLTINAAGGEFERIARADMEFGAVKVFFTSGFIVLAGYGVLLIGAAAPALSLLSLVVFAVHGYFFGKYLGLLAAVYGATGILNIFLIYVPFFLVTAVLLAVAGVRVVNAAGCDRVRKAALALAKLYAINMTVCFVIFLIVGSFTKVIVVAF